MKQTLRASNIAKSCEPMTVDRRILILGGGGFVGTHLHTALKDHFGDNARIINTTRSPQDQGTIALDLVDTEAVREIIRHERPTHVINLVGIASPVEARRDPALAWELHALAPDRLGHMLLAEMPDSWLLHVSSGLIYGRAALEVDRVDETSRLDPIDTYSMTKAAGDLAMGVLASEGLNCLRLRPFNHTGPRQTEDFVVPAFAAQLARMKSGEQLPTLKVGNLSAVRDFLDVRDVVDAYVKLIEKSDALESGTIYNIASGHGHSMRDILDRLVEISDEPVTIEPDPTRLRPSDLPRIVGDASALSRDTGWATRRQLNQTLADVLNGFRSSKTVQSE